jgi:hypothetical protein
MNMHSIARLAPMPGVAATPRRRPSPPHPLRRPAPPVIPSWASLIGTSCRRHLADIGIVLFTALFVLAGAAVGLLLIHRA